MSALWLWAFTDRSRPWLGRDAPEISRFSCILFLSVPWFSDYAGPAGHSRSIATGRVAFPVGNKVQRPDFGFSKLNRPAHWYPYLRFSQHLAMLAARLGAKMDSLLPSCRTLSFPTTCRFIPAHVAVGTTIADRPPHRSVRARSRIRLLPWISGGKANLRVGMQDS